MVVYYLKLKAHLTNVTDLQPIDTAEQLFEYSFKIQCTGCRTLHPKPVSINRFESHEINGSAGEANFVFRCHECKTFKNANISRTKVKYTVEDNDKFVSLLTIDARGIEFVEFIAEGQFEAKAVDSKTEFNEVDLEDGEWYDYDEKKGEEVSIVDVEWDVARS